MKFLKKLGFFTAFILPALVIVGYYQGGWWNYLTIAFVFLVITSIDYLAGLDPSNISDEQATFVSEEFYYRFVTYLWTFFQLGFLFWACYVVSIQPLALYEWIGFVFSTGLVTGGIGITVAHELGHKKSRLERFYSKLLLMTVCYMHFYIEHNRGHHVQVATPSDPATARKDENFYTFWIRSVVTSYLHAWNLEFERLSRKGQKKFSLSNAMISYTVLPFIFCGALTFLFSEVNGAFIWQIPVFFFSQSIVAFTLLELVNYVEHYGIVRKKTASGNYERVNPLHSWNASHLISNFFLFQLQRHSDHHANAIKRYQVLKHYDESPQLPFGYPTMVIIALLPPLWFDIMNKRLHHWHKAIYKPVVE